MGNIARTSGAEAVLLPHRCFTAGGETYLYASETGGLFRMDDGARNAMSALASPGAGHVPEEILSDLRRAGLVGVTGDRGPSGRTAHPPLRLRTLVLMLTYSCNLACRYCYEDREEGCVPGSTAAAGGGATGEMSPESLRGGVKLLLDRAGVDRKVSVTFFGGEPLLRFPLIRTAVGEARKMASERGKEISFSITTNGTLLTREIAGFLTENGISVCLSVDGPTEIHDRNRPYPSGKGSYADVARGIELLMENRNGFPVAARVTLGHGAVDVRRTFTHLRGLGFDEVGFAPASAAEGSPAALTEEELNSVLEGFRDLADGYVEDVRDRRLPAFSNLAQILALIHRGDPMPYPCGAGIGMLAVDPSGSFYPCHRLCGIGDSFGTPAAGISEDARSRFLEGARRRRETACDACWAKNFCSGGCYHDAYLRQGNLFAPSVHYCRWIKELFLLGLQTYVRIQNETPTFLDAMLGERGIA
ncbi:MAG: radical SAM protein [Deltaproteobacteria bacterium]|nr:MAG: radical SAM protein [Deltaproteobacteria bacterium]